MDWQGALQARLANAAPVAALVGTRIHWIERPQATALPAITLQTISDQRSQHFGGLQSLQRARVQIDVWGETYASVRAATEAAVAALLPAHTGNGVVFERAFVDRLDDGSERQGEATVFRASIDFIIHHRPA
jgi:hypothetical protein